MVEIDTWALLNIVPALGYQHRSNEEPAVHARGEIPTDKACRDYRRIQTPQS